MWVCSKCKTENGDNATSCINCFETRGRMTPVPSAGSWKASSQSTKEEYAYTPRSAAETERWAKTIRIIGIILVSLVCLLIAI